MVSIAVGIFLGTMLGIIFLGIISLLIEEYQKRPYHFYTTKKIVKNNFNYRYVIYMKANTLNISLEKRHGLRWKAETIKNISLRFANPIASVVQLQKQYGIPWLEEGIKESEKNQKAEKVKKEVNNALKLKSTEFVSKILS